MNEYHKSVLSKEVIDGLSIKSEGVYIDATFGGGGHTRAILDAKPTSHVIALDWDQEAIEKNAPKIEKQYGGRFKMIWGNFGNLYRILKKEKIKQVDGILADFGTSQFQIHHKAGLSFSANTPLDMRMSTAHYKVTAADVVNSVAERELANIFFNFGEEVKSKKIARAIVEQRKIKPFKTTRDLAELIESIIHFPRWEKPKIHPATKVFQALRIYVNKELENIELFLVAALHFLAPGGRLACISFHSLEDRLVKNFFRDHPSELEIITKKPLTASEKELTENLSARSAKLRIAKKKIVSLY